MGPLLLVHCSAFYHMIKTGTTINVVALSGCLYFMHTSRLNYLAILYIIKVLTTYTGKFVLCFYTVMLTTHTSINILLIFDIGCKLCIDLAVAQSHHNIFRQVLH